MGKKIRDTIHGYIHLTRVEEAISQHPLLLRLHYVHQTSFTYLTYPNAHSTRYPHSLGVMHVAGEIFAAALGNSTPEARSELAGAVRANLRDAVGTSDCVGDTLREAQPLTERLVAEVASSPILSDSAFKGAHLSYTPAFQALGAVQKEVEARVLLALLHQAVRLAALLHDVGHPPFSHIVEYALLEAAPDRYFGHEPKSMEITRYLIKNIDEMAHRKAFQEAPIFSEMALGLAAIILHGDKDGSFYGIKKTLLDGPIDADRLDYVRRDIYSSGLVPNYDVRRLVDAAFFRKYDGAHYEIAYQPNCLSAFENFFSARYDMYRWMIYHHDVVRRNLSIQRALAILLRDTSALRGQLKDIGAEILKAACGDASDYSWFVDSFLLDRFWQVYRIVEKAEESERREYPDEAQLAFFLSIVLARRNDKLETLLKRTDQYGLLVREPTASGFDHSVAKELNDGLARMYAAFLEDNAKLGSAAKVGFAARIETALADAIKGKPELREVTLYCYYVGTFQAGSDKADQVADVRVPRDERRLYFSTISEPSTPIWVQSVSPTLAMLQQAWSYSPQLLIFYTPPSGGPFKVGDSNHVMLTKTVRDVLAQIIAEA